MDQMAIPGGARAQASDLRSRLRQFVNIAAQSSHRTPIRWALKLRSCFRPPTLDLLLLRSFAAIIRASPWDIASERPSVHIANSAYATDSFRAVCLWTQLLTKVAYVKIDAPVKRRKFPSQDSFRQSFPGKHLSGRFQECAQQIKLRLRQVQRFSRLGCRISCQVQFQITRFDREWPWGAALLRLPTRSAEDGANSRNQFTRAEWLCQIVVRSHLEAQNTVKLVPFGRNNHNPTSPPRPQFSPHTNTP